MMSKNAKFSAALALAVMSLLGIAPNRAQAQQKQDVNVVTGITKPSLVSKPGLNQLGVVLELPVKEGDLVKKGQLLLKQDDRQEQAALEALELEANSDVRIEASKADAKVKKIQYDRYVDLQKKGSSNPVEVEEAQIKWIYAEAQVKIAELERDKNRLEAKKQRIKVEQMKMNSPVDGIVENIAVAVGDVTDPQKPLMTVVQNDPLWVEFFLPVNQSLKLKVGQQLDVRYEGEQQWQPAKLIYRDPVAEASAGMQKLRLELKNAQIMDTGLQMQVKLPPELGPAQPGIGGPAAALNPAP